MKFPFLTPNPSPASQQPSDPVTLLPGGPRPKREMQPEDIIQDYLEHLSAPLVGIVPYFDRQKLLEEAEFHLDRLQNEFLADGEEIMVATYKAIKSYGESQKVSEQFMEQWFQHQRRGTVGKFLGLDHTYALFFFGQASLIGFFLTQIRFYMQTDNPVELFGMTYAQFRQFVPEPIPVPDGNILTTFAICWTFVAPFLAGWLTGVKVPFKPARAVYQVMVLLILGSFALGYQFLPNKDLLLFGFAQLVWWLPMGTLTAHVAAAITGRRRCAYHSFPWRKL